MRIENAIALVTGANRGLGRQFAASLLERGAAKVYATARRPELVDIPGAHVLPLDITDPDSVAAAAQAAPDVTLLVNNAGISTRSSLVLGDLDDIRRELDTHFWGTLRMIRAFAPQLAGGAILNVLSAMSWFVFPGSGSSGTGAYGAAKAAEWNLTNAVRLELAEQRTQVTGLHLGVADTDMMAGYDGAKIAPADLVRIALDGVEAGRWEVVADHWTRYIKDSLSGDPEALYSDDWGPHLKV